MATYAQQSDFENYSEGWVTGDPSSLERLLERAEKDVDRLLIRPGTLTNTIQGIAFTGNVTGGTFTLGLLWNRVAYLTAPIPWNVDGPTLLALLEAMTDGYGHSLTSLYTGDILWQVPEPRYYSQPWAQGPLPNTPIVVEAYNQLGEQYVPPMTAVSSLTGTPDSAGNNVGVSVTNIVRGGLRINPYTIAASDAETLMRATCAQAEYRNEMGEEFFRRAQWKSVSGPEFKTTGRQPLIGPKVWAEFSGSDLIQRGARARPGTATGRVMTYVPAGGLPIPDDWRA